MKRLSSPKSLEFHPGQRSLGPLSNVLEEKHCAVLSMNRNFKRRVNRTIASIGARSTLIPNDFEQCESFFSQNEDLDLLILDSGAVQFCPLLDMLKGKQSRIPIIVISSDYHLGMQSKLLNEYQIRNIIGKCGGESQLMEFFDENELISTCYKIFSQDLFGLEKYLSTWGVCFHHLNVLGKKGKAAAIEVIDDFLNETDCYKGLVHLILLTADELLMNAMYSAPRDVGGRPKYEAQDRDLPLDLEPHEAIDVSFACDGRYIGLSVSDAFGSLTPKVVNRYLTRIPHGEKAEIERKQGGAGLGLHVVFKSSTQLVFNIHPGVRTEVIALFYVRKGTRDFREAGHSMNIFLHS